MIWGWTVSLAVLAPNLIWMAWPPVDLPTEQDKPSQGQVVLGILENIGRAGLFAVPVFYDFHVTRTAERVALIVMLLAFGIYYAGWVRFFNGGRRYRLLFAPMGGLPVPLAISPIIACLAASLPLRSWPFAAVALLFGVVHVGLSLGKK